MSVKPNKKPSFALGLILILLLLAAVILGGSWVVRQAFLPRQSDARPAAAAVSGQSAAAAQLPVQTAEETVSGAQPEAVPEPAAEPEPEPARVTLMAVGDNLIHNCVYWSAELPGGEYDFTPFYADIRPTVEAYDIACINQETIYVEDPAQYSNYPYFGSPTAVGDALAETGFDVVTAATNHCFDKGETGILDTIRFWRDKGGCLSDETITKLQKAGIRIEVGDRSAYRTDKRPVRMEYLDDISLPEFSHLPTFKRICICILKNDHACKYMGFAPNKNETQRRKKIMEKYESLL